MAAILGIDISHHQGAVDFAAVKTSRDFVVIKATEGVGFTDPNFGAYRAQAHAAGLIVGLYHFARAGDPAAEAAYFAHVVGPLQPGEFLVLDWEVPYSDPPAWCKTWLDSAARAFGVNPLVYMNSSMMRGSIWSTVAVTYGLWLAKYDHSTVMVGSGAWAGLAMKQYDDRATVPGITGGVDADVFFGTAEQLLAYGKQADPAPAPAPQPPAPLEEDDMPQVISDYVKAGDRRVFSIPPVQEGLAQWGRAWLSVTADCFGEKPRPVKARIAIQDGNGNWRNLANQPAMDVELPPDARLNEELRQGDVALVVSATDTEYGVAVCVEYARPGI